MDEQRIIEIETRLAYQEQTLAELNDVLTDQQAQLTRLEGLNKALEARLTAIAEAMPRDGGVPDERPPHY